MAHCSCRTTCDLCAQVYGANARSRGELAQLSPLVSQAAELGDATARDIFRRAGWELAQIADALRRKLGFEANERVKLSYSGGAFAAGELLIRAIRRSTGCRHPGIRTVPAAA